MGFTFDDTDRKGVATPLSEMHRLIDGEPAQPGRDLSLHRRRRGQYQPTHAYHRYVINFQDWPLRRADLGTTWRDANDDTRRDWRREGIVPLDYPEPVAADYLELLAIVEENG